MKGMFWKGKMDFDLYLEGNDLTNLVQGKALEAKLVNDRWKSIDKKLILKKQGKDEQLVGEEDGVFFKKISNGDKQDYQSIKRYEVTITQRLLNLLVSQGQTCSRYDGTSKMNIYADRKAPF